MAGKKFPYKAAYVACSCGSDHCEYGCIGCGACMEKCRFGAISLLDGHAVIDSDKCIACGACAKACPRGIIHIRLVENNIVPLCSNRDAGKIAREACPSSCIACGLCVKKCPAGAISLSDNAPVIDESLCLSCGACAIACPRHVIRDFNHIITD